MSDFGYRLRTQGGKINNENYNLISMSGIRGIRGRFTPNQRMHRSARRGFIANIFHLARAR